MEKAIEHLKKELEENLVNTRTDQRALDKHKKSIKIIEARSADHELQRQSIEKAIEHLGGWE